MDLYSAQSTNGQMTKPVLSLGLKSELNNGKRSLISCLLLGRDAALMKDLTWTLLPKSSSECLSVFLLSCITVLCQE